MNEKLNMIDVYLQLEGISAVCMALSGCGDITGYEEAIFYFLATSLADQLESIRTLEGWKE